MQHSSHHLKVMGFLSQIVMKRYIRAAFTPDIDIDYSMFDGTPFKCDVGTSFGNGFLNKKDLAYNQKAKNRTGEIVMMSPEDYYWLCGQYGFHKYVSVNVLKRQRRADHENVDFLKDLMEKGTKIDMCYINKADHSQEGLHRMMAAGDLYGWNTKYPVLVIDVYDQDVENEYKLLQEANDFRSGEFKRYCKWAATEIGGWNKPVPDDFIALYKHKIIEHIQDSLAYKLGDIKSIDMDIQIDEVEGHSRVRVYLTKYNDYEFSNLYDPYEIWLEDMFDVSGEYQDTQDFELTDEEINELLPDDLDDDSLADFFFKK